MVDAADLARAYKSAQHKFEGIFVFPFLRESLKQKKWARPCHGPAHAGTSF
jgi:hypothetical protein